MPPSSSRAATSLQTVERDTLYKLHRASVKADLRTARILERLGIEDVSDEDVDQALDEH